MGNGGGRGAHIEVLPGKAEIKAQKITLNRRCVNLVHGQANTNIFTNTCENDQKAALNMSES